MDVSCYLRVNRIQHELSHCISISELLKFQTSQIRAYQCFQLSYQSFYVISYLCLYHILQDFNLIKFKRKKDKYITTTNCISTVLKNVAFVKITNLQSSCKRTLMHCTSNNIFQSTLHQNISSYPRISARKYNFYLSLETIPFYLNVLQIYI